MLQAQAQIDNENKSCGGRPLNFGIFAIPQMNNSAIELDTTKSYLLKDIC